MNNHTHKTHVEFLAGFTRRLFPTAAVMLTLFFAALFFWVFGIVWLGRIKDTTRMLADEHAVLQKRGDNLRTLERLLEQIAPARNRIAAFFVRSETVVALIESLEASAVSSGVDLSIRDAQLPENKHDGVITITLIARGSFRNLLHYVQLLELLPYQLQVEDMRLSHMGGERTFPWEERLQLRVFNYTVASY